MQQTFYSWPKWGQHAETKGKNGESVDVPEAKRLMELYERWMSTADDAVHQEVWREMLQNHADNQWSIGTLAGALQPIVVRNGLVNVPKKALYSWEPTAMLGVYRIDEFYWDKTQGKEARLK
jgi:peptide/nickel transport system substrate-binding protein